MHSASDGPYLALAELLEPVLQVAAAAASEVMRFHGSACPPALKPDQSPVTSADLAAEALIVPALRELAPGWPVVAEEACSRGEVPGQASLAASPFWLVDPLDGTREFIAGNGEFTVNIALVAGGRPVLGVVQVPAQGLAWAGALGLGAWRVAGPARERVACRGRPGARRWALACSRSHGDDAALAAWIATLEPENRAALESAERRAAGSALKFGLVAQGDADVYPRLGRTMEWDTAAGDAVLAAAGGRITTLHGDALAYGKPGFENPHFVAWGF